jgi:hypothetical protein
MISIAHDELRVHAPGRATSLGPRGVDQGQRSFRHEEDRMKQLIAIAAFVTIGLFGYSYEAPSAQANNSTLSSPMVDSEVAAQEPMLSFTCPASRPICCEPGETRCLICITRTQQCP